METVTKLLCVLDHWQTLATGVMALVGAGLTVWIVGRQIKQARDADKDRLSREERASKAVLPIALSELTQYCSDCIVFLVKLYPDMGTKPSIEDLEIPSVTRNILPTLENCARFSNANTSTQMQTL